MLYITDSKHANINNINGDRLTIDFNFLKERNGVYVDRQKLKQKDEFGNTQYKDYRPMWLIDGQHRTRGLAQSKVGCELEIPIILFTDEFSLMESAKVFAEINTLQQKLDALHTLFMQHRFQIPSPNKKRDFQPYDIHNDDTWPSRQNHLSYECAGWLASHEGGPLYGRIKILEPNQYYLKKYNFYVLNFFQIHNLQNYQ